MEHTRKFYDSNSNLTVVSRGGNYLADYEVLIQDSHGNKVASLPRIYSNGVSFKSDEYHVALKHNDGNLMLIFWHSGDWYFVSGTFIYSPFRGYSKRKFFENVIDWIWNTGLDFSTALDTNLTYIIRIHPVTYAIELVTCINKSTETLSEPKTTVFPLAERVPISEIFSPSTRDSPSYLIISYDKFCIVPNNIYERDKRWTELEAASLEERFLTLYKNRELDLYIHERPMPGLDMILCKSRWFNLTKDLTRMKHAGKYDPYVLRNPSLLRALESVPIDSDTDIFGSIKNLMNGMTIVQQAVALYTYNNLMA
jgi:hypothetical protein